MKAIITFFISICFAIIAKSQTGELQGRVYDASTNEGIPFAPVILVINGTQKGAGQTDDNGNYTIKPLLPGSYELRIQYLGYRAVFLQGIQIVADRISFQSIPMQTGENTIVCLEVIRQPPAHSTVRDANCTPVRSNAIDQNAIAVSVDHSAGASSLSSGITQIDNSSLVIAGSREYAPVYYIDGVRIQGSMPSVFNVEEISIITGGLPAKYENANEPGSESEFSKKFPAKDFPFGYSMRVPF